MNEHFLTRLAQRVILLEGWRASVLAIIAGAISALALAPFHLLPVLFATFPILVWLLDGAVAPAGARGVLGPVRRFWPAFRTGWMFGFGYFLAGLWWLGNAFLVDADEFIYLLPLAIVALPAGLALFFGLATALSRLVWRDGWARLLGLAVVFTLTEWLRGWVLTGFPWNTLGYGFMPDPVLMQTANLIGVYGVTFITVFCASTLGIFVPNGGRAIPVLAVSIVLLAAHVGYGLFSLSRATSDTVRGVKLRIVQPAIDQASKWEPENEAAIMASYLGLSNENKGPESASAAAFTHIIWPESAFPFILTQRRDQLAAIANLLPPSATLITGAMRLEPGTAAEPEGKVFNSLYAINGNGEIALARDKTHLVPFGEFLPFQEQLEAIGLQQLTKRRGGFAQGIRRETASTPPAPPFLPLICYEIIYSGAVRGAGEDPQWIINLTNDAWFGRSTGPYQHAHQAQVRAAEEGLPVVRAANTGISMVIDGYGRVIDRLPLGAKGVLDSPLPVAAPPTYFSKFGNLPTLIFVCLLFLILVAVRSRNTNRL